MDKRIVIVHLTDYLGSTDPHVGFVLSESSEHITLGISQDEDGEQVSFTKDVVTSVTDLVVKK